MSASAAPAGIANFVLGNKSYAVTGMPLTDQQHDLLGLPGEGCAHI